MEISERKGLGLFLQITSIIFAFIPLVYLLITSPSQVTAQAMSYAISIFVIAVILFAIITVINGWNKMKTDIKKNSEDIGEIKKLLDFHNLFSDMKYRLSTMEQKLKNKRGQIDPRIIIWILLILLLYLFLKSIGIFR